MTLIIVITTFVAAFVQGVSGFGFALVAMPILSGVTSIQTAAPLVALTTLTNNLILCIYYRQSFDRNVITNLLLGSVLGIPIGFLALDYIPTALMLIGLGFVIVTYSLYSLVSPVVPVLKSKLWAYGAGFLSGILLGSFNLPGPPVILYGSSQRWSQEKFKGNLTSFFWVSVAIVVVGHGFQNRISEEIIRQFLIAIPGFILGLFLGVVLAKKFDPNIFRKVITVLLLVIGVRLIVSGIYL
ncbi:sulfite exporter TauE/SafE family protein [Leptolyngbya cf. ectocarpi LEGE 11479]|uniref:Probable membrane transporter protein n=1 Tax=Leptolyngbya cf. ectocarpi LEGE 11479 TaxID=1828722 RepID=A0A928WYU5_LEPEC|nr:sulfite exporter TauE/SafE family protein [Leptolyngbya ectocarpi]MBE9065970.1 sulfite exporter TauE/SafE family protein [Leptolyngbya cf. ectocarpi LEGE 11479]